MLSKKVSELLRTVSDLMNFLWSKKLWWMIPLVAVLLIFGSLIFLASSTAIGPFVYALI